MSQYCLITSRSPAEAGHVERDQELAAGLAAAGHDVTYLMVQNGVLPARRGARAPGLDALRRSGVRLLADAFSCRQRGLAVERLAEGITPTTLDVVVDALADGQRVLWL